jgi:UDPglucose 6-dehydrogenase
MFTTARNAELIKWASNAYLALKIGFANEIANVCEALGADAGDVLRGVGYDTRIGSAFLTPGVGFGGPSLEHDLRLLRNAADRCNVPFEIGRAALDANGAQPRRFVATVAAELGRLRGAHVAVWGLAFKSGTDDVTASPALRVVHELVKHGAHVTVFDPAVTSAGLPAGAAYAPSALAALPGADALLVLTDWPEFARIAPASIARALKGALVIDGRNLLDAERITSAGLRYRSIGRFAEAGSCALPVAI